MSERGGLTRNNVRLWHSQQWGKMLQHRGPMQLALHLSRPLSFAVFPCMTVVPETSIVFGLLCLLGTTMLSDTVFGTRLAICSGLTKLLNQVLHCRRLALLEPIKESSANMF